MIFDKARDTFRNVNGTKRLKGSLIDQSGGLVKISFEHEKFNLILYLSNDCFVSGVELELAYELAVFGPQWNFLLFGFLRYADHILV